MEIPINIEKFEGRGLALRTASFFSGPKLIIDGSPVRREQRRYLLRNNIGEEVEFKIKSNLLDPIPKLEVAGHLHELASPLKWYEYAWMGLPIMLVFTGGALGALFGLTAVYSSARIFRSNRDTLGKYVISGAISISAVAAFFILAMLIQFFIAGE